MKWSYGSACSDIQTNHWIWIMFSMVLTQAKSYGIKCPRGPSVLHTETSENMTKCKSSIFTILSSEMSQFDAMSTNATSSREPFHSTCSQVDHHNNKFYSNLWRFYRPRTYSVRSWIIWNGRLFKACLDQLGMHSPLSEKKIHLISNQSNLQIQEISCPPKGMDR